MNYLLPLSIMADRLRAVLPATLPVITALDVAQVQDQSDGNPQVWVVFHRDIVQDTAGEITLVQFQIAAVYLAAGILPDLARDGDALTALTKALAGFKPLRTTGLSPIKRVGSMVPQSWEPLGLVAYGMIFETTGAL
jgi:hypothetical protein